MNSIRMNGIKLSQPYVQAGETFEHASPDGLVHLYQLLSADRINIAFLLLDFLHSPAMVDCLVAPEHLGSVRHYPTQANAPGTLFSCRTAMGTLSLYPHRYDLKSLGYVLKLMGKSGFEFFRMASSTATLTFVVKCQDQENLAAFFADRLDLPHTHTPFLQGPIDEEHLPKKALETVATYVEQKIKVYGIQSRSMLMLCRMDLDGGQLEAAGVQLQELGEQGCKFAFASISRRPDGGLRIFLVVEETTPGGQSKMPINGAAAQWETRFESAQLFSPVALICLQGPHFGDRHGIAAQAFSALLSRSIPLWIAGCAGAAIHLVVPQEALADAEAALGHVFQMP